MSSLLSLIHRIKYPPHIGWISTCSRSTLKWVLMIDMLYTVSSQPCQVPISGLDRSIKPCNALCLDPANVGKHKSRGAGPLSLVKYHLLVPSNKKLYCICNASLLVRQLYDKDENLCPLRAFVHVDQWIPWW
jgi:hypothetical protein